MIKYAILGLLSARSQTGYDLKKAFASSPALYWSGNNNQIYTALSDLLKDGLVTKEVQLQEKNPAKSIYTVTDKGLAALKEWVLARPDPAEYRSTFWVRLLASSYLTTEEMGRLLSQYELEVHTQLLMQREQARRAPVLPARTPRDARIQELIMDGIAGFYQQELNWVTRLRQALAKE